MAPSQFLVAALVHWFERMGIRDGRLLVAVSGGLDSVALLQLLNRVKETAPAKISHLSVAHIDHRFREESVDDARFVNGVSAELGLDFYCEALPERPPKTNLEAWARKERYERLEHFRQRSNC